LHNAADGRLPSSNRRFVRQVLISHVENGRRLDLGEDDARYERFRRVYQSICEGLNPELEQKWWDWGTLEGFTII
jgi:hypothetical protein